MSHVLDRPVWNALAGPHAALAEGGALARRYKPDIIPFAAARDGGPDCCAALAALPRAGEEMVLLEIEPPSIPPGFATIAAGPALQMVLARTPAPVADARIEALTPADAGEMLALSTLTGLGLLTLKAQALGTFYGLRKDGRLVAMAGERLKPQGYAEVSGVCTHPDVRGQGLARLLSLFVTHRILSRGETPYLHAWTTNIAAIRLYEQIGYTLRTPMNAAVVRKEG